MKQIDLKDGNKHDYLILINPTNTNKYIDLGMYCKYEIGIAGQLLDSDVYGRNITLEGTSVNTFYVKGE